MNLRLIPLAVALVLALGFFGGGRGEAAALDNDLPHATCAPVAKTPVVTLWVNYAFFDGYTTGCEDSLPWSSYHYTAQLLDFDTRQVLNTANGTDTGNASFYLETWAMCLRGNGTGRRVQGMLKVFTNGWSRTSFSPWAQCQRQGTHRP